MPNGSIVLSILQHIFSMNFVTPVMLLGFVFALFFALIRR